MKTYNRLALIIITVCVSINIGGVIMAADKYNVDSKHSKATFKVSNFYVSKVNGSFSDITGNIVENIEDPAASSVEIVIKTESVDTHIQKRDNHLRSADFFDVKQYPTMSFKSKKVEKVKDGLYRVTGEFNLHGITIIVTVDVKKVGTEKGKSGETNSVFETNFNINRSDFGMTYDSGVIGDKVAISLHIVSTK
jgi:polyisoprenoid-binding protein YceI